MTRKNSSPDFEKAMEKLEELVQALEEGELSLEESLKAFEQGVKLTRECQQALEQAEQKVRILISAGEIPVSDPFLQEPEDEKNDDGQI